LKYLIKYTINKFGPFYFFEKLSKFLLNKEKGGARTTHQVNQIFNLMTYTIDLTNNKLKDENAAEFRQTFISLENEDLSKLGKQILHLVKENLKSEEKPLEEVKADAEANAEAVAETEAPKEEEKKEDKKDTKDKKDKKKKNKNKNKKKKTPEQDAKEKNTFFFIGLISFYDKYVAFLNRSNLALAQNDKIYKNLQSVSNVLEKVAEDYELKNMHKKITEIKDKVFAK
jgi:type IV secretory pathway VirB10-like protein